MLGSPPNANLGVTDPASVLNSGGSIADGSALNNLREAGSTGTDYDSRTVQVLETMEAVAGEDYSDKLNTGHQLCDMVISASYAGSKLNIDQ